MVGVRSYSIRAGLVEINSGFGGMMLLRGRFNSLLRTNRVIRTILLRNIKARAPIGNMPIW